MNETKQRERFQRIPANHKVRCDDCNEFPAGEFSYFDRARHKVSKHGLEVNFVICSLCKNKENSGGIYTLPEAVVKKDVANQPSDDRLSALEKRLEAFGEELEEHGRQIEAAKRWIQEREYLLKRQETDFRNPRNVIESRNQAIEKGDY